MSEEAQGTEEKTNDGVKPYIRKTEEEHERLAQDIVGGLIWGPWSRDEQDGVYLEAFLICRIFAPDGFMQWCEQNKITCFYEYLSEAGPRSINGQPTFFSMKMLDADDFTAVMIRTVAIVKERKRRMEEAKAKK